MLEDAERVASGRDGLRCVLPVGVDPDGLTRTHVADDLCSDQVERARLGGHHPIVSDQAEREGAEPERVAEGEEYPLRECRHRVGAFEPPHRVRHRLRERRGIAPEESRDHLRVGAGAESHPIRLELRS